MYANSQTDIESMKEQISQAKISDKLNYLTEISMHYHEISADSSIKYAELALDEKKIDDYPKEKAKAYICLGNAYYLKSEFDLSLDYYNDAYYLIKDKNYKFELASAYKGIADVQSKVKANYEAALEKYLLSLDIYRDIKDTKSMIKVKKSLGELYFILKQYDKSLEYLKKALKLAVEMGDEEDFVQTNHKIGAITIMSGNLDEGLQYCLNSLDISQKKGFKITEAMIRSDLADMYLSQNLPDSSISYNQIALENNLEFGNIAGAVRNYKGLANANISKNNFDQAIILATTGINLAREKNIPESNYYELFNVLAQAYQKNEQLDSALINFKNYSALRDNIFNQERTKELEIVYDIHQKENEINELTVAKQRNQIVYTSIVGALVLAIAVVFFILYRNKRRAAIELGQAKILAEKADKLKTEILANMTHEIKTPLSFINSSVMLLKMDCSDNLSEDSVEALDGLNGGVQRLNRTVDLYMNLAQIKSGNYPLKYSEFYLSETIRNIFLEYQLLSKREKPHLEINFNDKLNDTIINNDENVISTIIKNIVDNAFKYTDKGKIEINSTLAANKKIIEISDTGIGISSEYLPSLFEPFTQEEMAINRSYDGNGLGLALAKEFAILVGADIQVESAKGKGSKFTIIIN